MTAKESPRRLLRLAQVKEQVPIPTSAIYAAIADGTFPKQIKIGARTVAWLESDIQAWIDARIAESKEDGVL